MQIIVDTSGVKPVFNSQSIEALMAGLINVYIVMKLRQNLVCVRAT